MATARILESIDKSQRRQAALPEFRPGDSIKVWAKIREGEKTRLQAFEGVCIRRNARGARSTNQKEEYLLYEQHNSERTGDPGAR